MGSDNGVQVDPNAVAIGACRLRVVEDETDTILRDFPGAIRDLTDSWTGSVGASFGAIADSWASDAELWVADLGRLSDGMIQAAAGIEQATYDSARSIVAVGPTGLAGGLDQASSATSSLTSSLVDYHAARLGAVD